MKGLLNRQGARLWTMLGLLLVAAVATASAKEGYTLRYKSKPGKVLRYERKESSTREMERGGQTMQSSSQRTMQAELRTESVDEGLCFTLTVRKMEGSMQGMRGSRTTDFKAFEGKRVRLCIDPLGKQKEFTPIDEFPRPGREGERGPRMGMGPMGPPERLLALTFLTLPENPVQVGDTWTVTYSDSTSPAGGGPFMRREKETGKVTYTVLEEAKRNGFKCLHIKTETTYSREGHGSGRGGEMSSEGDGKVIGDAWFAYEEGVLVEYTTQDTYEGTTAFAGGQMSGTSAVSTDTKVTLKLLK
ncbi:MAG: hypothetical protein QHJ34_06475 [bacterium]|jgi:hypothetical protein|nr:hypothetical protein [candidate division KSB1 bacterium]MDH7559865.1 hypothetical protein [bacterium]